MIPIELTNAYQVGVYAGIEQGMEKGIMVIAKKLIEMGLDFTAVKIATGLSDDEIKELQKITLN